MRNAAYHPYSEDEAAKVLAEHDALVKVDMAPAMHPQRHGAAI